jgi:hypothetical protein
MFERNQCKKASKPLPLRETRNVQACTKLPDPVQPDYTNRHALKKDGLTTLEVFNMLGEEVLSVVNEFQSTGSYRATVDEPRLSSGTYV